MRATCGTMAAAALSGFTATAGESPRRRPNILVILADDMGYSDLGCYGSTIRTPNIDSLAREGLQFTQFYCAARCCPSRATILTGLYPHDAGMGGMVSDPDKPPKPGPYQGFLNDECMTIAEVLKDAGYRTYMSGKWHVGEDEAYWPRKRGFDRAFGLISGAISHFELKSEPGRDRRMVLDDERYVPKKGEYYSSDAYTDFAVECLDAHKGREEPFFLYLAYQAPHWPMHALPEDIARYRGKYAKGWDELRRERYARMVKRGIIDEKWALSPRDEDVPPWDDAEGKDEWDLRMAVYAAMIDRMDQGIGRVLDAVDRLGERDNTLVLFLSDNGGCHERINKPTFHTPGAVTGTPESYVAYERPWANASNTPFRLFKHWVHEGGIATPLVCRWPNGIKARGEMTDQVGHIIDFMPTFVEMAGAAYAKTRNGKEIHPMPGKSLMPIFQGETRDGHEVLYWEHLGNRAVRQGKWKLVAVRKGEWELYDLEADRTELHDLSETYPDKAEELNALWEAWADRIGVRRVK